MVAKISVTVVLQHSTNGSQGAVTGRTNLCQDTKRCEGEAEYRRTRMRCKETYHYDDYTQVTAWFQATRTSGQKTLSSKESRHSRGFTINPPEGGCK